MTRPMPDAPAVMMAVADQVRMVRKMIEGLGLEIATPDEAREILSLKGGDQVGF